MAEQTHTPGPWLVERSPNRKVLCVVGGQSFDTWICGELQANNHTRIDTSECLANARLLAAAPDLSDFASHTQWEVIMGALEKWTKDGGSQLVALGIIGQGLLILDEARRAALARATTKDNPHERGEG